MYNSTTVGRKKLLLEIKLGPFITKLEVVKNLKFKIERG